MRIKKSNGQIFGAQLTKAEQKAMNIEIGRQIDIYNQKNIREVDACVLWVLYRYFNFPRERLRDFYTQFHKHMHELSERFELGEEDQTWLSTKMLEGIGINLEDWERNVENDSNN